MEGFLLGRHGIGNPCPKIPGEPMDWSTAIIRSLSSIVFSYLPPPLIEWRLLFAWLMHSLSFQSPLYNRPLC